LLEFLRLRPQLRVGERRNPGLQAVDEVDRALVLLEQPLIAAAEDLGENVGDHEREALERDPHEIHKFYHAEAIAPPA
jgi:hypothetical protein